MAPRVIIPSRNWRLAIDLLWFYALPIAGGLTCGVVLAPDGYLRSVPLWASATSAALIIGMYIVVGLGAGWLKLWQFNPSCTPLVEGVVPQVGFLYGGVVLGALAIGIRYIAGVGSADTPLLDQLESSALLQSPGMMVAFGSVVVGVAGCVYDLPLLELDLLRVYTKAHFEGRLAVGVLLSYGPAFFGMVGAYAGFSAWYLRQQLGDRLSLREWVTGDRSHDVYLIASLCVCIAVIVIPALATFSGPIAWKLGLASAPVGASLGIQGLQTTEDSLQDANDDATDDAGSGSPSPSPSSSSSSEEVTFTRTKRARPSSRARRRKVQA